MSFRRKGKEAHFWRKRLEAFPALLQRAGLPDAVLQDDRSFSFFLAEACFEGAEGTPLIDALEFLSVEQQEALHALLSKVLTPEEQIGNALWRLLDARFLHK